MGRFQGNACPQQGSEVAHVAPSGPWTRAIWARAAAPAIPSVREVGGHLTSEGTRHHADYVGADRWVVDYLPGRQLTREQATAAMRIAIAPERLEVDRWAGLLGLTAAEARGFAELPVGE